MKKVLSEKPSLRVTHHFSMKLNDFSHCKFYKIPHMCLSTNQLGKLSGTVRPFCSPAALV